jgi:hypothetical protein
VHEGQCSRIAHTTAEAVALAAIDEPITGDDGELTGRFISAVNQEPPSTEGWWYDLGIILTADLGGSLGAVALESGKAAVRGSLGAMQRANRRVVDRDEFFELIRRRITELVASGMRESFLVRALRDEVTRYFDSMADFGGPAALRRAEQYERFQRMLDDPAERAEVRERLPGAPESDEELVAHINRMLHLFAPFDADQASERLANQAAWVTLSEAVSEAVIDDWEQRQVFRFLRD